ncbi:uncharacterized protein LOC117325729 isoform X2 [Pecten maximus]|nr:uncharacterized protein LOC117325729 isoform X2 [Pecten maximus]
MSTRVDVINMPIAGRTFSTILPSSIHMGSLIDISVSSKLLPNSSHPSESKMILNSEHTTTVLSNENNIKSISPTRSSFYQSESFSHPTNDSALIYSVITPSVNGFSSSYITKVPVFHTDYNMDAVDTKDKPDSKVALGIVIGVFVIIVAVLLAMIFRVVFRSAMETKVEDMPRATENERGLYTYRPCRDRKSTVSQYQRRLLRVHHRRRCVLQK